MSSAHSSSWEERLAEAIQSFPLWGRLRASTQRGHAITAFAFEQWSRGGLGIHVCDSETKSVGPYFYACAFQQKTFEPLFVDWKSGWCLNHRESQERFQEDVGSAGYSYSFGRLSAEQIVSQRSSLVPKDQLLVAAMVMHLDETLGSFSWSHWEQAVALHAAKVSTQHMRPAIPPVDIGGGKFAVVSQDPFSNPEQWPTGLTSAQLCTYLGASVRDSMRRIAFFEFQDALDQYMLDNPACRWTQEDSERLASSFNSAYARPASAYFSLDFEHKDWPSACTRVVAPHFATYMPSFFGSMEQVRASMDKSWFLASHGTADSTLFDMFGTVFQGKLTLCGDEDLQLRGGTFRVSGSQGERGVLLALDTPEKDVSVVWDILRQARAYCGGILAVGHELVEANPTFWQQRFERKEVAALLDEHGEAIRSHRHYHYEKKPVELNIGCEEPSVLYERSLFQEHARAWRGSRYLDFNHPWGWKQCMDSLEYRHPRVFQFPEFDNADPYESRSIWCELLQDWFLTMQAGEASVVLSVLRDGSNCPIENDDWERVAKYYLADEPSLLAVCEMMGFTAEGVLSTLRRTDVREQELLMTVDYSLPVNDLL